MAASGSALKITVREFEEADRPALRHLYVASRNAAFHWNPSNAHQLLDFDRDTVGEIILVALAEGGIVGFASIWAPDSFLHHLFVHPSAFRRGVGTALLAGCAKYCSKTPTLKCVKENVNAMAFYQSRGWAVIGEGHGADGPYCLMHHAIAGRQNV